MEVLSSRILLRPSELERSLQFYEEALGFAVYREWGEGKSRGVVFFLGGACSRSLAPRPRLPPTRSVSSCRCATCAPSASCWWQRGSRSRRSPKSGGGGSSRWSRVTPMGSRSSLSRCRPSTRFAGEADFRRRSARLAHTSPFAHARVCETRYLRTPPGARGPPFLFEPRRSPRADGLRAAPGSRSWRTGARRGWSRVRPVSSPAFSHATLASCPRGGSD